jgi:acetamidase/formamidase
MRLVTILLGVYLGTGSIAAEPVSEFTGTWELSWVRFGETNVNRVHLQSSGDRIIGKGIWGLALEGEAKDGKLQLNLVDEAKKVVGTLKAQLDDAGFTGSLTRDDKTFPCRARRAPNRPRDVQTHHFGPTQFHNHFSATVPPVLRISPGDTVRTETVDAGGYDKRDVARAPGGNPLTGPFYVEGALSGDTLAVHFNRIRLNRDRADSGASVVLSALDPYYATEKKPVRDFDSSWHLDREHGYASLAKPTERLRNFKVPLAPMLGCVGVAPPGHQSIRSGDLGRYGGNMDYNGLREGTTLYLPVFEPGALLFIGDGHAAEGDGELTGDALETSMDVEFTVDVIQDKSINGPRLESEEYLMAIGIGNALPEALQLATTELARWLDDEYHLNPSEVAIVLGFAIRYEVAEVVDPHVNLVAKIKKSALGQLPK